MLGRDSLATCNEARESVTEHLGGREGLRALSKCLSSRLVTLGAWRQGLHLRVPGAMAALGVVPASPVR